MTGSFVLAVILSHIAATLFMVGAVWFVQVVHYPLMAGLPPEYAREHGRRTGWVLGPVMLLELATALLLAWVTPSWPASIGLCLLALIWVSTFCVQVPCHNRLVVACDTAAHRRLVATNWLRTVLWTTRGGLAIWALAPVLA